MAATVTTIRKGVNGDQRYWQGTITGDTSYPTGGYAITAAQVGMNTIQSGIADNDTAASRLSSWDQTNKKLKLFTALSTEAANASNQSTITVPVFLFGY